MKARRATTQAAGREPPQTTVLRGRRLLLARGAWIVVAALTLGLFVASIPFTYGRFLRACENSGCDVAQLSPEGKNALEEGLGLGLSMGDYAAYTVFLALHAQTVDSRAPAVAAGYFAAAELAYWSLERVEGRRDRSLLFRRLGLLGATTLGVALLGSFLLVLTSGVSCVQFGEPVSR